MRRMFPLLRAALTRNSLTQADLAKQLNRSYTYVNQRMAGHKSWSLNEVRDISRWLGLNHAEIEEEFFSV